MLKHYLITFHFLNEETVFKYIAIVKNEAEASIELQRFFNRCVVVVDMIEVQ